MREAYKNGDTGLLGRYRNMLELLDLKYKKGNAYFAEAVLEEMLFEEMREESTGEVSDADQELFGY